MIKAFFTGEMVEIVFRDDQASCEGILCKAGERFSAFYMINNWCVDGLGVFPNDRIKSCNRDDYLVEREKIVFWKGIATDDTYEWIELDSSFSLFNSIHKRNKGIYVADDDDAEVGIILSVNSDCFALKGIDGAGNYLPDDIEFPFSEVCSVYIDDMYGKTLIEYAESLLNRPGFAEGFLV